MMASTMLSARQLAVTRNRPAEIRVLQMPPQHGTTLAYRGLQVWMAKDDQGKLEPVTGVVTLPTGVVISNTNQLSPLVSTTSAQSGQTDVNGTKREHRAFTLRADGSLKGISSANSFMTLVREVDASAAQAPANFSAVYVNPVTGEISIFRP